MGHRADRIATQHALGSLTWPEVAGSAAASILVVPLGSTEQHGPHLPLGTDSHIAIALAGRLVAARPNMLLAPLLPYGSTGEHADFAGTLSIGAAALELVVVELVRSADAVRRGTAEPGETAPLADLVASVEAWPG